MVVTKGERPYRVHVVVDPNYGERIRSLPTGEPAWIADSAENHLVIQALWQERKGLDQFTGITLFKYSPGDRPDDLLISMLSIVDLHHGEYSHDPPYSALNIIGVSWSEAIQQELNQFAFSKHEVTLEGFVAERGIHEPPSSAE